MIMESDKTQEIVFKGTACRITQAMKKLEELYNDPKSHIVHHEIEQPISDYALQDLKSICKPLKVDIVQEMIPNNRAKINFIGKDA